MIRKEKTSSELPPLPNLASALQLFGVLLPVAMVAAFFVIGGPSGCRRPRKVAVFEAETSLAETVKSSSEAMMLDRNSARPIEDVKGAVESTRAFDVPPVEAAPPTPKPPPPPAPPSNAMVQVESPSEVVVEQGISSASARFVLKGIIWSATEPLALVNDQTLGVGESVGGWKVLRIERERVVLGGADGKKSELGINDEFGSELGATTKGKP